MKVVCACLGRSARLECPDCQKYDVRVDPKDMPDKDARRGIWLLPAQVECPEDVPPGTVMRIFPNRDNAVSASPAVKVLMSGYCFKSGGIRRIAVRVRRRIEEETTANEKVGSCQFFRGRGSVGGAGAKAVRCSEEIDLTPGESASRTLELVGAALPPTLTVGQWVSVELNYPMIIEESMAVITQKEGEKKSLIVAIVNPINSDRDVSVGSNCVIGRIMPVPYKETTAPDNILPSDLVLRDEADASSEDEIEEIGVKKMPIEVVDLDDDDDEEHMGEADVARDDGETLPSDANTSAGLRDEGESEVPSKNDTGCQVSQPIIKLVSSLSSTFPVTCTCPGVQVNQFCEKCAFYDIVLINDVILSLGDISQIDTILTEQCMLLDRSRRKIKLSLNNKGKVLAKLKPATIRQDPNLHVQQGLLKVYRYGTLNLNVFFKGQVPSEFNDHITLAKGQVLTTCQLIDKSAVAGSGRLASACLYESIPLTPGSEVSCQIVVDTSDAQCDETLFLPNKSFLYFVPNKEYELVVVKETCSRTHLDGTTNFLYSHGFLAYSRYVKKDIVMKVGIIGEFYAFNASSEPTSPFLCSKMPSCTKLLSNAPRWKSQRIEGSSTGMRIYHFNEDETLAKRNRNAFKKHNRKRNQVLAVAAGLETKRQSLMNTPDQLADRPQQKAKNVSTLPPEVDHQDDLGDGTDFAGGMTVQQPTPDQSTSSFTFGFKKKPIAVNFGGSKHHHKCNCQQVQYFALCQTCQQLQLKLVSDVVGTSTGDFVLVKAHVVGPSGAVVMGKPDSLVKVAPDNTSESFSLLGGLEAFQEDHSLLVACQLNQSTSEVTIKKGTILGTCQMLDKYSPVGKMRGEASMDSEGIALSPGEEEQVTFNVTGCRPLDVVWLRLRAPLMLKERYLTVRQSSSSSSTPGHVVATLINPTNGEDDVDVFPGKVGDISVLEESLLDK